MTAKDVYRGEQGEGGRASPEEPRGGGTKPHYGVGSVKNNKYAYLILGSMTAEIIDGKQISQQIMEELVPRVKELSESGIVPGLATVLVGDDPASKFYVKSKKRACEKLAINSFTHEKDAIITQNELISLVAELNADPRVHGILVQLPLPDHIDENSVIEAISPAKDVDGFTAINTGKLLAGRDCFAPATPLGILELLIRSGNRPEGKHAVIVGRSNIVGKPLAALLMQKNERGNATVTICHSRTLDIVKHTLSADILVAAIGRPNFITASMVKEGAVVIDVGINRVDDQEARRGYRLVGDVDFEAVSEKAGAITPVPGGVGPMTIAMLISNVVKAATILK